MYGIQVFSWLALIFSLGFYITYIYSLINNQVRPTISSWILCCVGGLCAVIAIPAWSLAGSLTTITFPAFQIIILLLMLCRFV